MMALSRPRARRAGLGRPPILWAIGGAWALALVGEATGAGRFLHHDSLIKGGLPMWAALGVFLVVWQGMIAAMMLPSSLPLITLFDRVSASQPRPRQVKSAFLGGYAAVWTASGGMAFLGDVVLHRTVDRWPWLAERPWLGGGVLAVGARSSSRR